MKAHEDFFLVILQSYIVVAAEELLNADSRDGCNCLDVASEVVTKWVKCQIPPLQPPSTVKDNRSEATQVHHHPVLKKVPSLKCHLVHLMSPM